MQTEDKRLSALLREWQELAPAAGFEAAVWRRIRTAGTGTPQVLCAAAMTRKGFGMRAAWVNGLAAAAGILVGMGAAFLLPAAYEARPASDALLRPQTLAGSYLALVTEKAP